MIGRLPALVLSLAVSLAPACTVAEGPPSADEASESLRVLLVTGGGWHDYPAQIEILTEGLGARVQAEFTVDFEAGTDSGALIPRHRDDAWAREFDLVVYNTCFSEVTDSSWVDRLVRAHVEHQVPAVVLHCALHSYNYQGDNPIWSMFTGVLTRRHQRQMPFNVEALEPDHPVMAGLATPWETPAGELYEILEVYPTATPLAHAFGEDSGEYHPTVWTNEFEGVRVFGTTIGHHNVTMEEGNYLDLVAAGLLWAAHGLEEEQRASSPSPATGGVGDVAADRDDPRKVVFVAGTRSHGYGAHEHNAGSLLLGRLLDEHLEQVEVEVHHDGWPEDPAAFDGADAIVIFANGGPGHPALPHLPLLGELMDRGVGLVLLHYAVEVPAENAGAELLEWVGGYFETHWSVNPHWVMQAHELPDHPVARGVRPYAIDDEWYYHMRFRDGMEGVVPILTALPPASSLEREDGPHSGNPDVREAILERDDPQHLAWAAERPGGGRGFGFTGAHWHWNWGHPMQRRIVLNAIVWAAGVEVPEGGVPVGQVTMEDLEADQDYAPPENFDRERWSRLVQEWTREFGHDHD